jgi:hypothetical protein
MILLGSKCLLNQVKTSQTKRIHMGLNLKSKFVAAQAGDDVKQAWSEATGQEMPEFIEITLQHIVNEQSGGYAYYSGRSSQTDNQLLTSLARCPQGAIVWQVDTSALKNAGLTDEQVANPTAAVMEGMGGKWVYISGEQLLGSGFGVLINDGTDELADELDEFRDRENIKSLMVTYRVSPVLQMVNLTVKGRPTTSVTVNFNSADQVVEITQAKSGITNVKPIEDLLTESRSTSILNRQASVTARSETTLLNRQQMTQHLTESTLGKLGVTTAQVAQKAAEQAVTV